MGLRTPGDMKQWTPLTPSPGRRVALYSSDPQEGPWGLLSILPGPETNRRPTAAPSGLTGSGKGHAGLLCPKPAGALLSFCLSF